METKIARKLRSNPTDAEKRLWARLRDKQVDEHRFRRQSPIGNYVVDFVCPKAKLIIEVDGGQHSTEGDAERTQWLEDNGYRVIRYWNNEFFENIDGVVDEIRRVLLER